MKLGDLVQIVGGGTPDRSNEEYWNGDIPWISVKDFSSEMIDFSIESITQSGLENSSARLVPKGNVIIPSRMSLGKVAINKIDCAINQDLKALIITDKERLTPDYLFYFLKSNASYIESKGKGATVKGITIDVISEMQISLPPMGSQKQLNSILHLANILIQKRKHAIAKLDELIQSVFLEMFGDPATNSKKWNTNSFREVSIEFMDGPFGSNLKTEHYQSEGIRVIRLQNIGIGKLVDSDKVFISSEHYNNLKKFTCLPGDVLVGTLGNPNLRACIQPDSVEVAINKADCLKLRPNKQMITSEYICNLINNTQFQSLVASLSHGQTRSRISMGQLSKFEIPVPPMALQLEYSAIFQQIESQKRQMQQQLQKLEENFQSLLQRTFNGELELQ